ncbi:MAG: hypothetical protein IKS16_05200 [Lachnospiraceae bacterium]|nr:hypothetical protein [Lachnospiraceae bacterium]
MGFGSTLWNGASKAAGFVKGAASSVANSTLGQMAAQTMGNVEKAVIEIADFSGRKIGENEAPKPGGGHSAGMKGLGGFDESLAASYGATMGALKAAADNAADMLNADGTVFDINKDFHKFRFEVPFNPSELTMTGYGGEEMMVQSFTNKDAENDKKGEGQQGEEGKRKGRPANRISAVTSHIELSIPLLFDKTNNQDAFYSDKFTLGATNIARGAAKLVKDTVKGESNYSVQNEVEAFTYIMRNKNMHLMSFTWGDMSYQGILNGVNAEYTMFNINGEPCRATVTLRLVLLDSDFEDQKRIWIQKFKNNTGMTDQKQLVKNIASMNVH